MRLHADGFTWIQLEKAGGAQQSDSSLRDIVGRDFECTKLTSSVQDWPHNITFALDRHAFHDSIQPSSDVRRVHGPNADVIVWRDQDAGARAQMIEKVDSFFMAFRTLTGACKAIRKQEGSRSKVEEVLQSER